MDTYSADRQKLKPFLTDQDLVDADELKLAKKAVMRCCLTEFEFKAGRHAARGRRKAENITARASEFFQATKSDWKVESHEIVVAWLEKAMAVPEKGKKK